MKDKTKTTWYHMRNRCNNKNNTAYQFYGGRGIKVEWKTYQDFLKDMGEKPEGTTIERINVNGNYSKKIANG